MDFVLEYIWAFAVGGAFCVIAQILLDKTALTPARILVGYVVAGVILEGVGIYKYLVDFAGCGATTPLVGFGYLIATGVRESVNEKGFIGIFSGELGATAAGIGAVLFFAFLATLVAKGKPKN